MTHQVRIGQFATACRFKADPARQEVLRRAVDTTCRTRLDNALQQALDPVLDGHDGVIRIRRLDLDLTTLNPLDGGLAQDIARRIALLVRAHLGKGADGVQSWPDHAAYLAHYVLWRLGLRAGADWAFADFEALRLVSPQQAAIEVLAARPAVLATLAHDPSLRAAPDALARAFDGAMAAGLINRIAPTADAAMIDAALGLLVQSRTTLAPVLASLPDTPGAASSLLLILRLLAALTPKKAAEAIAPVTLIARIATALASQPGLRARQPNAPWAAQIRAVMAKANTTPELTYLAALAPLSGAEALFDTVQGAMAGENPASPAPAHASDPAPEVSLATPAAGLALLIPGLIAMERDIPLTDPQRFAVMMAALPEDARAVAALHPGITRLFPHDPHAPAEIDADPLAQDVIARFADRLPGLRESSVAYLQVQFLTQPGDLALTDTTIDVALHRVPLGIVLSMGGHLGLRGAVPWLADRKLTLSIKGGV